MKVACVKLFLCCFLVLCLCGCMTTSSTVGVDNQSEIGDYSAARRQLESDKNSLYNNSDQVLYQLDSGILSHYARDYEQSNIELAQAEQFIFENYTKSVTQAIGSWITNDKVIDYPGEAYEDIYTNLFMALNYINMGNLEDAMVEIRRFDNKQKSLSTQYQDQIAEAQTQTKDVDSNSSKYSNPQVQFYNSALARYLSMILYRAQDRLDDAAVDQKMISDAFKNQSQLYPFDVPSCVQEEFNVPKGMARLNFFAFAGQAPTKYEDAFRMLSSDGSFYYKLAVPVMKRRGTRTRSIVVTIEDGNGQQVASTELERIESIENIAVDTFQEHQSLIYFKTLARSIAKAVSSSAMDVVADNTKDDNISFLFSVLSFATKVGTEITEQADLRTSRYFPAVVSVGGVTVEPGVYRVTTEYLDASGHTVYTEVSDDVRVDVKSANIVETVCLR